MSGLRTTTGCWTCRIRRKKCDDRQPSCGPCTLRELTCHGYGPKPAWMDSADNQKAEVERIKRAVNQSFRSRRAFRISKNPPTLSRTNPTSTERRQDATSSPRSQNLADLLDENTIWIGTLRLETLEDDTEAFPHFDPLHEKARTSDKMPLRSTFQAEKAKSSLSSSVPDGQQRIYPFSFHPDAQLAENERELTLILSYLDNIFPLQYYFYQPASLGRGRGWLLSLLLRAKSSYFTALTFSCISQLIWVHKGNVVEEKRLSLELDRYHSRALSELQAQLDILPTSSGYWHLKLGVEILACMIQLMSIEVFRETKEYDNEGSDWEVHLQAAGTLLSIIGTKLRISSSPSPSTSSEEENSEQRGPEVGKPSDTLPLNEIAGLDFFMTAYIWSDICRCGSIGANPSSGYLFPYLTYLEEERVRLDHMMGCRNWAMIAIKKISDIEAWKQEMQESRTLSIPTLSRRAAEIEERLHEGLKTVFKDQITLTIYEQECNLVTELYALYALTYLAVVVSGNSHLLPEVRSSASKSLKALKAIPPHLLIRVSLPYCAAGCMAEESEKEAFRQLLFNAHANGFILGTLWNGLEIMEEFWKLREDMQLMQSANKCAWALTMDSLGTKLLLI